MLQPKDTGLLNGYKNKTYIYAVYKRPTADLGTHTDKIDFKIKNVTRDKEGHYIMITGSIQEEDITIINIYAPT